MAPAPPPPKVPVLRTPSALAVRRLGPRELEADHAVIAADLLAWVEGSGAARRWGDRTAEIVAMVVENATYSSVQQLLVCDEAGRRRGILAGWRTARDGVTVGFVEWVAVDPAHRRRGIGRGLVAAFGTDPRFERLAAEVDAADRAAAAFWGHQGFWPAGDGDGDEWVGPAPGRPWAQAATGVARG